MPMLGCAGGCLTIGLYRSTKMGPPAVERFQLGYVGIDRI
jgi:hypothetical protein